MRKLNKQDFIFIWGTFLFIVVTFKIYLLVRQYFIIDNCPILDTLWGLGSMPHICFWYLKFFDEYSIYFYVLFLWITIVPFLRRKYLFPSKAVFIGWAVILTMIIFFAYRTTHIIFFNDLPKNQQQLYFYR